MIPNIIYDYRRSERHEPLMKELDRQGIDEYKIWNPVEAKTVVESINATHKMIVRWAKEMGMEMTLIFEDDIAFPAEDGYEYFLRNLPETFDIYSAATYTDDIHNKNILCGFHCYIVHSSYYDKFLSVKDDGHIDTEVDRLGGNFKVCRPMAALQRVGWSANNKVVCNYNAILKPEDIYYGNAKAGSM
jgi:hypothetical protein